MRDAVVVHLIAADTPATRLDVLAKLCAASAGAARQLVFHVGSGALRRRLPNTVERLHAALPIVRMQAHVLARHLRRRLPRAHSSRVILHAWSPAAADWAWPLADGRRLLLIEADLDVNLVTWARRLIARGGPGPHGFVCQSQAARRQLIQAGALPNSCAVIRPAIEPPPRDAESRAASRARLRLPGDVIAIAALPTDTRRGGVTAAAWATLILDRLRSDVRLLLPATSLERPRAERLLRNCERGSLVHTVPPEDDWATLLAAADLGAFLPSGDAGPAGLALALASGCPVVATRVPAATELLQHGDSAWLCRPSDPADAARRLLQAIEEPAQSRRQARRAQQRARELFSLQQMLAAYHQVYGNLVECRPAAS